jgi:hypothetical protein
MAHIPISADIPSDYPGLGFSEYAHSISDAIRGAEPPRITIGVYGAWGSGKSSLLNAIKNELASSDDVFTVYFDAWRYEGTDHIVVPLLHRIHSAVASKGIEPISHAIGKALRSLVHGLNFSVAGIQFDPGAALESSEVPELDAAFSLPLEHLRKIPEALANRRIVVLIDDLDRCTPRKLVSVLESIKLVLDLEGFIFVLALDYDVLVTAVREIYPHAEGEVFIQKIVQLPFRVPPLDISREGFLQTLVPGFANWGAELSEAFEPKVRDVASLALGENPRQIKRLVNLYLLLERIGKDRGLELVAEDLVAILGLQLQWPDAYSDLADAVRAKDESPLAVLDNADDQELVTYVGSVFRRQMNLEQLEKLITLNEIAVVEEQVPEEPPLSESGKRLKPGEKRLAQFRLAIVDLGYEKSQRSERLYYLPGFRDFRIALGKNVVRFEKPDDSSRWMLIRSYRLSTEFEDAMGDAQKRFLRSSKIKNK